MNTTPLKNLSGQISQKNNPIYLWFDLTIYISVMFIIRELYFSQYNFITNGLFWSFSTLVVASILMRMRGVSWSELGLCKPQNYNKVFFASVFIFAFTIISIIAFQMLKSQFNLDIQPDTSGEKAVSKFGDLSGNWSLFLTIIPFIWLQSMLEEMLDRAFLINWIEKSLASVWFATVVAVVMQATIFGFRHSYDLSERSITVGLIGLAMGIGYVCFGRNLWPLIFVHCILNTMSMVERV